MSIKIIIADDHPVVVEGISNLLRAQQHLEVIATYNTGAELLQGLAMQQPDVLLLDIQFPDTTGNDLARAIIPKYPEIRILVLSGVDNIFNIKDMMQQGCAGYILKNVSLPTLVKAIETVHAGKEFLEPELKEQLFNSLLHPAGQEKMIAELTQREQKILELISRGHTNMEIAKLLFLSYRTIQNNRLTLYQKLDAHNTPELIKKALQQGLIQ